MPSGSAPRPRAVTCSSRDSGSMCRGRITTAPPHRPSRTVLLRRVTGRRSSSTTMRARARRSRSFSRRSRRNAPQGPGRATIALPEAIGAGRRGKIFTLRARTHRQLLRASMSASPAKGDRLAVPILSDGSPPGFPKNREPAADRPKASGLMKYVHGAWICPKCGSSRIAAVSKALQCEICSDGMRRESVKRKPRVPRGR